MKIVNYPHPALRHKTRPLTAIDKQVRLDAGQMLQLMYESRGIGLAANQVVLPYRMLVLNVSADPTQREQELVCINPVIVERKGTTEGEEGCLSFPGLYGKVRRARSVKVQAYNLEGQAFEVSALDLTSRALQHEIDHLDGVLFIDKMSTVSKLASRSAIKEFERQFRRGQERGDVPSNADLEKLLKELGYDGLS